MLWWQKRWSREISFCKFGIDKVKMSCYTIKRFKWNNKQSIHSHLTAAELVSVHILSAEAAGIFLAESDESA